MSLNVVPPGKAVPLGKALRASCGLSIEGSNRWPPGAVERLGRLYPDMKQHAIRSVFGGGTQKRTDAGDRAGW
jgi:hypothetical protein